MALTTANDFRDFCFALAYTMERESGYTFMSDDINKDGGSGHGSVLYALYATGGADQADILAFSDLYKEWKRTTKDARPASSSVNALPAYGNVKSTFNSTGKL